MMTHKMKQLLLSAHREELLIKINRKRKQSSSLLTYTSNCHHVFEYTSHYMLTCLWWSVVSDDDGPSCFSPPLVGPHVAQQSDARCTEPSTLRAVVVSGG